MIAEAPSRLREPAIPRSLGAVAGLGAGLLMLVVVWALRAASGVSLVQLLSEIGSAVLPNDGSIDETLLATAGFVFHALLAAMLGALYAACQERVPARGLFAVGIAYGVFLWVALGSAGVALASGSNLRSWTWLIASVTFGLILATVAAVTVRYGSQPSPAPAD